MNYEIMRPAIIDLDEIDSYISADNPAAAGKLLEDLIATFELIAITPGIGRLRKSYGPRIRSYPLGNYLIFYRKEESTVSIMRVFHGARNITSEDFKRV